MMGQIVLVETFGVGLTPFGADIHDLTLAVGSGGLELTGFAGNSGTARIVNIALTGGASFQGNSFLGASHDGFLLAEFGGHDYYLSAGRMSAELAVSPSAHHASIAVSHLNSGFNGDTLLAVGASTETGQFIVATQPGVAGLAVATVSGGVMSTFAAQADNGEGRISDLVTLDVYGQTWVLASSDGNDSVISYSLSDPGTVTYTAEFGAADGLGVGDAVALRAVVVDGQPYVLLAGAESSSISVLSLEPDGSFRAVDHVIDSLNTRFADIVRLETTEIDGITYVVAAGSDDGFSLFRFRPDGKLMHLGSFADTAATVLDNPSALAIVVHQNALHIAAASGTEAGISHFAYDLAGRGNTQMGSSGDETLTGSAKDDMLLGAAGDDHLYGMAGNDVLIDGAGSDILVGGEGQDTFVFHADGVVDTVYDFQRGLDQLDLSFIPGLYSLDLMTFLATGDGATLIFEDEIFIIRSADGNSLTRVDLALRPAFNLDRPPIVLNNDPVPNVGLISGTENDDVLFGTAGSETLSGGLGNDTMVGGAGADRLFGGGGYDVASYATSGAGVIVDLDNPGLNAGDAAGDRYYAIEAIIGSDFDDILSGTGGRDDLHGGGGADRLDGGRGDDLLRGGDGDDWLRGWVGYDLLDGGAGIDIASYADAGESARVYLAAPHRNTGQAKYDTFISIEGVEGTGHSDYLYGDSGDNWLYGGGGNDKLVGMDGGDRLFGGAGRDRLYGSNGNDVLYGGSSADTLNGGRGTDLVSYADAGGAVTADLGRGRGTRGDADGDRYYYIERLEGSAFSDYLTGGKRSDRIYANDGNDSIYGLHGNDRLYGQGGNDRM